MMIGLIYCYHLSLTEQASTDANAYRHRHQGDFFILEKEVQHSSHLEIK
jgi:hypothetical protein